MSNTYIDLLMTNHSLLSDSSDDIERNTEHNTIKQMGGNNKNDLKNRPTGSFPQLYFVSKEVIQKEEESKQRLFAPKSTKTALSIKEIMQERREDRPFISL